MPCTKHHPSHNFLQIAFDKAHAHLMLKWNLKLLIQRNIWSAPVKVVDKIL